jgi:hypothetical protein
VTETVRYRDVMAIRVAPELRAAIRASATRYGVKPAEYVRNALWTAVALQGSEDAPDIRADGKRRYARIEGGAIVDVIYRKPASDANL